MTARLIRIGTWVHALNAIFAPTNTRISATPGFR